MSVCVYIYIYKDIAIAIDIEMHAYTYEHTYMHAYIEIQFCAADMPTPPTCNHGGGHVRCRMCMKLSSVSAGYLQR